jgi:GrpB-like predicted nucleotidyltransferase (UPF0157 family)
VYVVVADSEPHIAHVAFRDYLRQHPDALADYAALKRRLAARYQNDRFGYTEAKAGFIVALLKGGPA